MGGVISLDDNSKEELLIYKNEYESKKAENKSELEIYGHIKILIENNRKKSNNCILKIICINDVYELDFLPHYSSCKKLETITSNKTIGVLPGDFVSPSLLSSLDFGTGMVNCLSLAGMDYVCLGK